MAKEAEGTPLHTWLLRLGAVGYVIALHTEDLASLHPLGEYPTLYPEPARLFRVPDSRPRAYLVSGARPGGTAADLARAAVDLDPAREALIAGHGTATPPDPAFEGAVHAFAVRPDRQHAEVECNRAAWLVLVDAFDPGWRAYVDGAPVAVLRANVGFRAVHVGPGRHTVDLVHRPSGLIAGLIVSGLGAVTFLGLWRFQAK